MINGRDETRLNAALSELTGEGHKAIAMPLTPENCKELVVKAAALSGPLSGFRPLRRNRKDLTLQDDGA